MNGYAEKARESLTLEDFLARTRTCRVRAEMSAVTQWEASSSERRGVMSAHNLWVVAVVAWWSTNPKTGAHEAGERWFLSSLQSERDAGINWHYRLPEAMDAALQRVRDSGNEATNEYTGNDGCWRPLGGRLLKIGTLAGGRFIPVPEEN